jgi:uncharacterized membrane protein
MEAATETSPPLTRPRIDPVAALGVAAILALGLIPVEIHRLFGLPAHPLLLHAPVVLVPLLALALLAVAARPSLFDVHGVGLGVLSVVSMAATFLAVGAGQAFREDRGGGPPDEMHRLAEHADAGETLRLAMIGVTAVVLVALFLWRRRDDRPAWLAPAVRVLFVIGAVAAAFLVIRTGHLGAQLTWGGERGRGD